MSNKEKRVDGTAYTATYLYKLSDDTFQMEENRYRSLVDTSARLITCISIIAVALMAVISIVAPAFCKHGIMRVLVALSVITFVPLLGSLVVALCSQIRFKYEALGYPADIAETVKGFSADFENEKEAALHYARSLQKSYVSLCHRNDIIQRLVTGSTICLFVTVGLIVISVVVGAFCLTL